MGTSADRLRTATAFHAARIQALPCSPDGKTLATTGRDGRVILWDLCSAELDVLAK